MMLMIETLTEKEVLGLLEFEEKKKEGPSASSPPPCRMVEVEKEVWTAPPPCRIHPRGESHTWPTCLECQAIAANPPWNEAESQKQASINAFSNDDRIGPMSEAEAACLQDRQKAWLESLEPRGFVMSLPGAKRKGLLPNDFQPSPSTS